ncbi:MAG TPA: nickel transporter permease [Egibacteraceae bacterium]|nr:nickel transporter permease [Egibacteraceae bacterium]
MGVRVSDDAGVLAAQAPAHPLRRWVWLRALRRDRTAMLGLAILSVFAVAVVFGPLLAPHDPALAEPAQRFAPPSAKHPLGTDHVGRDVASRLLHGARLSLGSAVLAALAVAVLGLALGMAAGYFRGAADAVVSRAVDVLLAFPTLLLALAVVGALGPSLRNVLIAVVIAWWASYTRVVRGVTFSERERPYIESARALGASAWRTMSRHLLPNIVAPIVVLTTLDMGTILLGISSLSFLGLGVEPGTPEWGAMLAEARTYMRRAPHLMFYPGAAIFLAVLGFNLLGDGLRDILDPRTRGERGARPRAARRRSRRRADGKGRA